MSSIVNEANNETENKKETKDEAIEVKEQKQPETQETEQKETKSNEPDQKQSDFKVFIDDEDEKYQKVRNQVGEGLLPLLIKLLTYVINMLCVKKS